MEDRRSAGTGTSKPPRDVSVNGKVLDAMSPAELAEELEHIWGEMDADTYDEALIDDYLEALDRKAPIPEHPDVQTAYKLFLERVKGKESKKTVRRGRYRILKAVIAAAVVAGTLIGVMITTQAAGFDMFARIARWTAETFGFGISDGDSDPASVTPPQLEGMKEEMVKRGIPIDLLPTYWPEAYEQSGIMVTEDPESRKVSCAFGDKGGRVILSCALLFSASPKESYNIDDESLESYEHNGIEFYIMTNEEKYLAVWISNDIECRISGLESYEELIEILDSIGG